MINYETIEYDVDGFNPTARKIKFEKPVRLEDYGEVEKAVLAMSSGMTSAYGLFVGGEYLIEGLTEESVMWRLAEISENFEVKVECVD